jgi:hypothetical protein
MVERSDRIKRGFKNEAHICDKVRYNRFRGELKIMFAKFLVFAAAILLALPATTAVERDLGPYQVSFSLVSGVNCTIQAAEPAEGRTPAGIEYVERSTLLDCDDGRAEIKVKSYNSPVPAGDDATRALSRKSPWQIGVIGVETDSRLVDRHTGFLTTFEEVSGKEVYQAAYWLDRYLAPGDYLGETSCVVTSSLPWTATKELLETVHVEKAGTASKSPTMKTVTAGHRLVSFDLGGENYTIVQEGPEPADGLETNKIILDGVNRAATIEITSYDEYRPVNLDTEMLLAETALRAMGYTKNNASEWTIGGEAGVLGVGEDEDHQILYVAIYWPDQVQTEDGSVLGLNRCEMESSYWWGTTEMLLDTIRVEMAEV